MDQSARSIIESIKGEMKNFEKRKGGQDRRARCRLTILDRFYDEVSDPSELLSLPNLTTEFLESQLGDREQENDERWLKWVARYGLIGNTQICGGCSENLTLVRDARIDNFTWRCSACRLRDKSQGSATGNTRSLRHDSFFADAKQKFANILLLLARWCENPRSCRTELGKAFNINHFTVLDWHTRFAFVAKMSYFRTKATNFNRSGKDIRLVEVKNEVQDDAGTLSEQLDVTELIGGGKNLEPKNEPLAPQKPTVAVRRPITNKTKSRPKSDLPEEVLDIYLENIFQLREIYQVKDVLLETFVYDYMLRKHCNHEKVMNNFLFEITQCYEVERRLIEQKPVQPVKRKRKTTEDLETEKYLKNMDLPFAEFATPVATSSGKKISKEQRARLLFKDPIEPEIQPEQAPILDLTQFFTDEKANVLTFSMKREPGTS
ncbi:unnamed protein product, partial [Mesorhabditis belari]|uniref:Uncharacterized protein n=1 Tax=Mesorhabditis belari TaxID=2138241 RepID=A0AAF3F0N0_9BILA